MNKVPDFTLSIFGLCLLFFLSACEEAGNGSAASPTAVPFEIKNLSDEDYPDNPDIGFRADDYQTQYFAKGEILPLDSSDKKVDLRFLSLEGDTISMMGLDLTEFIPTIPQPMRGNGYISYVSCINQEYNRNQVKFVKGEFTTTDHRFVRMDVARNCLMAYLWEVILYVNEGGKEVPYAHGWFDFPHDMYAHLFEEQNGVPYETYKDPLEHWVDPETKFLNASLLRSLEEEEEVQFADCSDAMYPLAGARKKKFKEIVQPTSFETMRDLQSDSSTFATFSPPGFYDRSNPKKTELGRFFHLEKVSAYRIKSQINGDSLHEIVLEFSDRENSRRTRLILGGLDFAEFPILTVEEANSGWKNSMGIGNHTFYENYSTHQAKKAVSNPYYAYLSDQEGNWLDSHHIGIDGPVFHFSDENRQTLHLWLLSFERHAFVGHYSIRLNAPELLLICS